MAIMFVKSEETKVIFVLALTFALFLFTGILPQYVLFITLVIVAIGIILGLYLWRAGKKAGGRIDERSERCSFLATRNAFLVSILLATFQAVMVQMGIQLDQIISLRTIWALGLTAYLVSYALYRRDV
jgi:hypothetical protein